MKGICDEGRAHMSANDWIRIIDHVVFGVVRVVTLLFIYFIFRGSP